MIKDIDIESVMNTRNGREFVYWVLSSSGLYRSSYNPDNDSHDMAFKEGMRNVGLMMLAEIRRLCPEQYFIMIKEQTTDDVS